MKNTPFKILIGLTLVLATFISCNKEEKDNINVDRELMIANSENDFTNELDFSTGVEVANENSSYSSRSNILQQIFSPPCATITVDNATPGEFPKIFTVDFGSGCVHNGITRSGILTITFSDYLMNTGSVMTIVRGTNYYINGRKLEGTITYENQTTNTAIPKWSRTIENGVLTTLTGAIYTFSGTRIVQQTEGVGTLTLGDNVYEILSGTHTVNRPNGTSLTVTVVETLIKKYACNYISQGKLNLQGTYLDGVLDYGNNTCDNQAVYTHSNGQVYNINL